MKSTPFQVVGRSPVVEVQMEIKSPIRILAPIHALSFTSSDILFISIFQKDL